MEIEQTTTQTQDDVEIELLRYGSNHEGPTILLVHGTINNQRCWAPTPERGIAPGLARSGLDVWTINMRGRGSSETPDEEWGIRAYADQDVPAALRAVHEATGGEPIHYAGHSLGGMIYFILCVRCPELEPHIASATTLAGSIDCPVITPEEKIVDQFRFLPDTIPVKKIRTLYRKASKPFGINDLRTIANPDRVSDDIFQVAHEAFSDTSPMVTAELAAWDLRQKLGLNSTLDDQVSNLIKSGLLSPVQMINSPDDQLVDIERVREAAAKLDNPDLTRTELSPDQGSQHRYDHLDMLYAEGVEADVLPRMVGQVQTHATTNKQVCTHECCDKEVKKTDD